jgi:hypothetical protein
VLRAWRVDVKTIAETARLVLREITRGTPITFAHQWRKGYATEAAAAIRDCDLAHAHDN